MIAHNTILYTVIRKCNAINTIFVAMVLVNVMVEGVDKFDTPL